MGRAWNFSKPQGLYIRRKVWIYTTACNSKFQSFYGGGEWFRVKDTYDKNGGEFGSSDLLAGDGRLSLRPLLGSCFVDSAVLDNVSTFAIPRSFMVRAIECIE